jgi:hypothetical protein
MTSLRNLQHLLLEAVLNTASEDAIALVDRAAPDAEARLAVYRNTVRSNVTAALESTYPAVRRLVGVDYFRRIARDFALRHPSRSGDLRHAGAAFPAYLAELHRHDQYGYLGDVARLELLIEEALLAAEHPPLDVSALAAVAPAAYDEMLFLPHPALRLFTSPYPIRRIWESNVGSEAEPEIIDLASGGERLAVLRQRLQLQFHPLSPGEWRWLTALGERTPFAASLEAATAEDPDFDAAAALRRFVALGALVAFR